MRFEDQLRSAATKNLENTSKQVNVERALRSVTDPQNEVPKANRFSRPILMVAMVATFALIGLGTVTALRTANPSDSLTGNQSEVEGEPVPGSDSEPLDNDVTATTSFNPDSDIETPVNDHSATTGPEAGKGQTAPAETETTTPTEEDISDVSVTAPGSGSEVCASYRLFLTIESERAQSVSLDADALTPINFRRNTVLTDMELDNKLYRNSSSVGAAIANLFAKPINADNPPSAEIDRDMATLKAWYEPGCVNGE